MGHPIINKNKGIEFSTGSLAMGLSIGVGLAIAKKIKKTKNKVYVVIGDGECNEGAIWESAMSAYKYNLDNLVVILDKNNFQQTGSTKEIMDTFNLENKWQSFGWDVITIDGHNHQEIFNELKKDNKKDIPKILIANTIKGKGISLFENNNQWHHSVVSKKIFDEAIQELENKMDNYNKQIKLWSNLGQRASFGLLTLDLIKDFKNLHIVSADVSTSAGLDRFKKIPQ